jgi:hypothetical protein
VSNPESRTTVSFDSSSSSTGGAWLTVYGALDGNNINFRYDNTVVDACILLAGKGTVKMQEIMVQVFGDFMLLMKICLGRRHSFIGFKAIFALV